MKSNTIEKIEEFDHWFGHGKKGHLHGLLAEDYYKEVRKWILESFQQIADEAKKEGSAYVGKTKREYYQKGFEDGKKEERERIETIIATEGIYSTGKKYFRIGEKGRWIKWGNYLNSELKKEDK